MRYVSLCHVKSLLRYVITVRYVTLGYITSPFLQLTAARVEQYDVSVQQSQHSVVLGEVERLRAMCNKAEDQLALYKDKVGIIYSRPPTYRPPQISPSQYRLPQYRRPFPSPK